MKKIDLSLILACYNEEKIIEQSVKEIESILDNTVFTYEIILVDDKSKDRTRNLIKKISKDKKNFTFFFHKVNQGRGKAVSDGIKKARGKVVGFIDIDLEVSPIYIPYFTAKILSGVDVVSGRRVYRESLSSLYRAILSRGYSFLVKKLLAIPLNDTETGYKFFNHRRILPVLERTKSAGWFWDTEIMTYSYYEKLRILEIPVLFIRRHDKQSSVNVFGDTRDYLFNLMRFRKRLKNEF